MHLEMPPGLARLLAALRDAGGRPYVVGGAVRDAILGLPVKDYDVEVFGLPHGRLEPVLAGQGRVDAVGQAFRVYKLSGVEGVLGALDVALPRRDSKVGPGHRGIAVEGDPTLSIEEAARRRDFTMNAMLLDLATGELLDPWGGRRDLEARRLRAVDPRTFGEDPLRALRAVQFAARYELEVDEATAALCAAMPLAELPSDRVFGEIEKLLLKARRPSLGLTLLKSWGMLPAVAPELLPLEATPQDAAWHPEGDVWGHTLQVVDAAAALSTDLADDRPRRLALMLGALCHDLGKPSTTLFEDGRIRSRGHEEAGLQPTRTLLDRWNVHTLLGYDVREQVLALVAHHLKPGQLYDERDRVGDGAVRRLARKCEPDLLYRVAKADCLGRRPGAFEPVAMEWFRERARQLDVAVRPPEPILKGRDVVALGVPPGPEIGRILREVYERQLDGEVTTLEEARAAAQTLASAAAGRETRLGSRRDGMDLELKLVAIDTPADTNLILGQSHFIKTVEDLYEALVGSVPGIKFGLAFCEASGACLIRTEGTDEAMKAAAVAAAQAIGAGHSFVIVLKNAFPVNVLNAVKACPEVCRIYCATANPLQVVVAQTEVGRGILGVVDGSSPKGVEDAAGIAWRQELLQKFGYKR
jgi:tRNA nucleotidyltransferase (CCA-adding enzyme)